MHFVVVGCGAVGGYFGGRLAQHGENVTFVARGEQLLRLKSTGLTVQSIDGDFHIAKPNVINANEISDDSLSTPVDVIFIAVKSYQLSEVIKQIKPLISQQTRLIPLLNGINSTQAMTEQGIASENIYAGLAKIICQKTAEGVISHTGGKPHITLGDEKANDRNEVQRLGSIAKCLTLSGVSVGVSTNINLALWRKFIMVAAWGALGAARKLTLGEIREQSHIEFLLERIVNEYAQIGRKLGIEISDKHIKETLTFFSRLPASSETSMQRDIAQGLNSEFDVLVAYPLHLATELGVSTPVLSQCFQTLSTSIKVK